MIYTIGVISTVILVWALIGILATIISRGATLKAIQSPLSTKSNVIWLICMIGLCIITNIFDTMIDLLSRYK